LTRIHTALKKKTRREIADGKSEDTHELFYTSLSVSRSEDTPQAG